MAAMLGRLAAKRLGSSGGAALGRTAALPRSTHTEAVTVGKEGELRLRRMQEKKEELYNLMAAAYEKDDLPGKRNARLVAELSAHVKRDDENWRVFRVLRRFTDFWAATGALLCGAVLVAGSCVPVANAVVWLSYACSSEYGGEPETDPSAGRTLGS